jgi:hypothetical protein
VVAVSSQPWADVERLQSVVLEYAPTSYCGFDPLTPRARPAGGEWTTVRTMDIESGGSSSTVSLAGLADGPTELRLNSSCTADEGAEAGRASAVSRVVRGVVDTVRPTPFGPTTVCLLCLPSSHAPPSPSAASPLAK